MSESKQNNAERAWATADLRVECGNIACQLAGLIDMDDCDGLSDADMRAAYRTGVEQARKLAKSLK